VTYNKGIHKTFLEFANCLTMDKGLSLSVLSFLSTRDGGAHANRASSQGHWEDEESPRTVLRIAPDTQKVLLRYLNLEYLM
jgi:hypothetical protein